MFSYPVEIEVNKEDEYYTSVLLQKKGNLGFFGTNKGTVEIWDIEKIKKLAEMRYLEINKFGESIPVEDPVIELDTTNDFELVYSFMGNYAYVFDVRLRTIIEQIPISNKIISGSVGKLTGKIAAIAENGYLSIWSPKFNFRIDSHELNLNIKNAYLVYDFDENRIFLIGENDKITIINFDEKPWYANIEVEGISNILNINKYDENENYQVYIDETGKILISNDRRLLNPNFTIEIFIGGKFSTENMIRDVIDEIEIDESQKQLILDSRLSRKSKDRYNAEVDILSSHHERYDEINEEDDSKTLNYALQDYSGKNIETRSIANEIINKISKRHEINPDFIKYAWIFNKDNPEGLISEARFYEIESDKRNSTIRKCYSLAIFISLVLLLLSIFSPILLPIIIIFVILFLFQFVLFWYWSSINSNPILIYVEEYRGLELMLGITTIFSLFWLIFTKWVLILNLLNL